MFEILLVDDDPAQVKLMQLHLQALPGAETVRLNLARDGVEAQDYLLNSLTQAVPRPDLILLDLNMPKMNGQEFLEWLRREGDFRIRCIPLIVLTTSNDEREVLKAYEEQIAAYIPKPPDSPGLGDLLQAMKTLWVKFSVRLPDAGGGGSASP